MLISFVNKDIYFPLELLSEKFAVFNLNIETNTSCLMSCLALQINLAFNTPETNNTILFNIHSKKPIVSSRKIRTLFTPFSAELNIS